MRRFLCFVIALVICSSFGITSIVAENLSTEQANTYIYPISADSETWKDYTVREKVEMLRIPDNTLKKICLTTN